MLLAHMQITRLEPAWRPIKQTLNPWTFQHPTYWQEKGYEEKDCNVAIFVVLTVTVGRNNWEWAFILTGLNAFAQALAGPAPCVRSFQTGENDGPPPLTLPQVFPE